jgi:hypothetical protein
VYAELPLHTWDEADFDMVNDLSDTLLDSVCHYFTEDFFASMFIRQIGL